MLTSEAQLVEQPYPVDHSLLSNVKIRDPKDATEWAHLQLSIGAAATEAAKSLGLSLIASKELTERSLSRAQSLNTPAQLALRRALEEVSCLPAGKVEDKVSPGTNSDGRVVSLLEYKEAHRDTPTSKAPKSQQIRRRRLREERAYVAQESGLSDQEIADYFFAGDEEQRAQTLDDLAYQTLERLSDPKLVNHDNIARAIVVLVRASAPYKESAASWWVSTNAQISKTVGAYLRQSEALVYKAVGDLQHESSALALEDLIAEGQIGLLEALGRFDLASEHKVISFIFKRIRGAALDAIRQTASMIRLRRVDIERVKQVRAGLDQGKTMEDISEELDVKVEALMRAQTHFARAQTGSLEIEIDSPRYSRGGKGSLLIGEVIRDPEVDVERAVLGPSEIVTDIEKLIQKLPEREQTILRMRFGYPPMGRVYNLREIGEEFGFSESRACQIMTDILDKLYRGLPKDMKKLGADRRQKTDIEERLLEDFLSD